MRKVLFIFSLLALLPIGISAQTIVHDDQKEKQWKSMENGPWDFAPDWYYWLMHNSYSGASTYWAWRGFHSGLHVRFRLHRDCRQHRDCAAYPEQSSWTVGDELENIGEQGS